MQHGFFKNLKVINKTGVKVLTKYLDECHAVFAPYANTGCNWRWGQCGEDVFVQRCTDHHYANKVGAFDATTDGACEADRRLSEKKSRK